MYIEKKAATTVIGELESENSFSVEIDHLDDESPYEVTAERSINLVSEFDFNEMYAVMKKAKALKKSGFKP